MDTNFVKTDQPKLTYDKANQLTKVIQKIYITQGNINRM